MSGFRYWRDPLCLACCGLYALNRWGLKPRVHSEFLHSHFNDVLLIPCALPGVLWLQRRLGLREHDRAPAASEILFHLIVWSILFEWVGPHLMRVVGDVRDVAAYAVGAVAAWLWWERAQRSQVA